MKALLVVVALLVAACSHPDSQSPGPAAASPIVRACAALQHYLHDQTTDTAVLTRDVDAIVSPLSEWPTTTAPELQGFYDDASALFAWVASGRPASGAPVSAVEAHCGASFPG